MFFIAPSYHSCSPRMRYFVTALISYRSARGTLWLSTLFTLSASESCPGFGTSLISSSFMGMSRIVFELDSHHNGAS